MSVRKVALGGAIDNTWCWFSTDAVYNSQNQARCHDSYIIAAQKDIYSLLAAHQRRCRLCKRLLRRL